MMIKKILKFICDEFVYGGHLTSLGAVSIVISLSILINTKVTLDCLLIIYLSVYAFLLYDRFKGFKKDFLTSPKRTAYLRVYIKFVPYIISCVILSIILILLHFGNSNSLFFVISLLLLGFFYSLFFKKFTKKIIGFKTFFISLLAGSLVIFFYIYYSISLNLAGFLFFSFVFLRLFVNTNFFDIKDVESDKKEKLLTLPIVLKKKYLFCLLTLTTFVALLPIFSGFYFGVFPIYSLTLFLTLPYTFFYFNYFKKPKDEKLYYVFIDGELILWTLVILIGKILL